MSAIVDRLEPPLLLIAMPQVVDPFFNRSVVLLLEHDRDGSFGVIVNRPTELLLSELLDGLGVTWGGPEGSTSWFGGPVQPNVGTLVWAAGPGAAPEEAAIEFAPGFRITRDVRVLGRIASDPPPRIRLFLGYAGWGGGQLEDEIERSDWLLAPFGPSPLFDWDPAEVWTRTLESIGIRPEALPSTIPPGQGEETPS